jgi:hypothetical protein
MTITGGETGVATRGSYQITGLIRLSDVVLSSNGTGARIAPSGDRIPRGQIDLYNSVVTDNDVGVHVQARYGDLGSPDPGGILVAQHARFEHNGVGIKVAAGDYPGGGGTAHFNACAIDGNREGGVWVGPGSARVSLYNSSVSHNSSNDSGGGIHISRVFGGLSTSDNFPIVSLERCTVNENTAMINGGGLYNGGVLAPGPVGARPSVLRLSNVTISGNTAEGAGGGVYNDGSADPGSDGGQLDSRNCTITDNHAAIGGGVAFATVNPGRAEFADSIIGGNSASTSPDCSGELQSLGHDLIGDTAGCVITGDTTDNILDTNPRLVPLADNGGPTRTHALSSDSPAIDAGGDDCLEADQRGVTRPQDGDGDGVARCDIGAYEYERTPILAIEIDIMPGSERNSVNPRARGVIPVAVLGSATFDVTIVDDRSLRFGPGGAPIAHRRAHLEDVNLDGIVDLMLHFRTRETGIVCENDTATLTGETLDGQRLEGIDSLRPVGCRITSRPAVSVRQREFFDSGPVH